MYKESMQKAPGTGSVSLHLLLSNQNVLTAVLHLYSIIAFKLENLAAAIMVMLTEPIAWK